MQADVANIRSQIDAHLKIMGYYPNSIKINSLKASTATVAFKGQFHEYLGETKKFSGEYDIKENGFRAFEIEDDM